MSSVVLWQGCAFYADSRKSNPENSLPHLQLIQNVAGCLRYPALTQVAAVSGIAACKLVLRRVGCVSACVLRATSYELLANELAMSYELLAKSLLRVFPALVYVSK